MQQIFKYVARQLIYIGANRCRILESIFMVFSTKKKHIQFLHLNRYTNRKQKYVYKTFVFRRKVFLLFEMFYLLKNIFQSE
jgi:hypothetical protein